MAGRTKKLHPAAHLASRSPRGIRAVWCACGAAIVQGLDEDLCATIVRADIQPLSITGEALALIDNRNTYELRSISGTAQLMRRNHLTIASRPPASRIWCGHIDILVEHSCNTPALPTIPTVHPVPAPDLGASDDVAPY